MKHVKTGDNRIHCVTQEEGKFRFGKTYCDITFTSDKRHRLRNLYNSSIVFGEIVRSEPICLTCIAEGMFDEC